MSKELNKALDLLREIRPSIPKDVLELWCKDRDAFLASHKAPVEQAGGDERAGLRAAAKWHREQRNAFEAEAEMHRQRYENTNRPDSLTAEAEHHRRLWETASAMAANHLDYAAGFEEMARAALAQPSPAPTLRAAIDVANDRFEVPVAKWGTDLAEAERPEVMEAYAEIGRAVEDSISRNIPDWSPSDCPSEVIVHLINERDAALAEVERLTGVCASLDSEKREMEHKRDAIIAMHDAALARVAELGANLGAALGLLRESRGFVDRDNPLNESGQIKLLEEIDAFLNSPVAQAQQLHDLDKQCRDDVARALGLRPSQERGFAWSYLLASIKSCVKASEDAAQAQHSVPAYVSYTTRPAESLAGIALRQLKDESRWVEIRDINAHTFPDMQSHSYYPAGTVIKLPAAAPGKEGL
ncbi:LysM peptidoglycan-binding domain-containing protein [Pseudomonas aeruginosa]